MFVASTFGAVVFNDTFETGGTSGWFTQTEAPVINTAVGAGGSSRSLQAALRTPGTDQQFLKYFDSQALGVGDSITMQWQMRSTYAAGGNLLRFGLYNSGGSQIASNVAFSDAALADYTGYSGFINNTRSSTGAEYLSIVKRDVSNPTLIAGAAHTSLGVDVTPGHMVLGNSVFSPTQTFTLTRTASGWDWASELGGLEGHATYTPTSASGSFSDAAAVTTFDTIGIWYTPASDIYLDNVSVTVVPEPATLGLLACAGGCMLAMRRRIKG